MNLDEELRGTLLERAEQAPAGAEMLDGVRGRARRITRRRRTAAAGLATVVVVAGAVTTPYVLSHRPGGGGGPAPAATEPTTPPAKPSSAQLVPAAVDPVVFPLTPDWKPPGVGTPTVGANGSARRLVYGSTGLGPYTPLVVEVGPARQEWPFTPTKTQQTTVGSRPATLVTGDSDGQPAVGITWRLARGGWVAAYSLGGLSSAQLKRYAQNLRAAPTAPAALPFTLALAPRGFQTSYLELSEGAFFFCLSPKDDLNNDSENAVCLRNNAGEKSPNARAVTVDADPGQITTTDGVTQLDVYRPGFEFSVSIRDPGPLNEPDLIRFAAGVAKR